MKRHKHYQAIRAFADGWGIEYQNGNGEWINAKYPTFDEDCKYRVVPDENGWLPWYGGDEAPVPAEQVVDVKYIGDSPMFKEELAGNARWNKCFLYRIVPKRKKVKMWQWVVRDSEGGPTRLTARYTDVASMQLAQIHDVIVEARADWTEIEVEL